MSEEPLRTTPLPKAETATVLLNAWSATGLPLPSKRAAELLLGLIWLENRGGAAINNFNWGNLSVRPRDDVRFWRPPWFDRAQIERIEDPARRERMQRLHVEMTEGRAPSAFRAFADHFEGAQAWIQRLKERFPSILDAAASGDPQQFAQAYHSSGYCPSPECAPDRTTDSFARLAADVRAAGLFDGLAEHTASGGSGSVPAIALGLVAVTGLGLAAWRARKGNA